MKRQVLASLQCIIYMYIIPGSPPTLFECVGGEPGNEAKHAPICSGMRLTRSPSLLHKRRKQTIIICMCSMSTEAWEHDYNCISFDSNVTIPYIGKFSRCIIFAVFTDSSQIAKIKLCEMSRKMGVAIKNC